MLLRYATDNDIDEVKDIWTYCFDDSEEFIKYYFKERYLPQNNIVLEEEGKIISSLQLAPYKIILNNREYYTSYVVGVSTLPESRGKGFMNKMMDFTIEELYKRGEKVSILMPIDYSIYRKFGYEHCYDQIEYNIDIFNLRDFKISGDFHKSNGYHIESLVDIADNFQKYINGNTVRDAKYYSDLFDEVESEDGNFYIYENDGYKGYIVYSLNGETMFVREIMYKDTDSLKAILAFIYNHNTQCKRVTIISHMGSLLKLLFKNLKDVDVKIIPFMMGRIINVEKYFKSLECSSELNTSINVKVIDNQIRKNNRIFKLYFSNKSVEVEEESNDYDLEISINILSQLAFSYLSIEDILDFYEIEIDVNKKISIIDFFNSIFTKKNNYINDYI